MYALNGLRMTVSAQSKCGFIGGSFMITEFFIRSLIGAVASGILFEMECFNIINIVMCLLSKLGLVSVFISIFIAMSIVRMKNYGSQLLSDLLLVFIVYDDSNS